MNAPLKNFLMGMGSIVDLYPSTVSGGVSSLLNRKITLPRSVAEAFLSDRRALASDWSRIGQDFRRAMVRFDGSGQG